MWHCPSCGAPQAESARCWVCRRSSTTCSTCRHFRPSLAADVGWCSLDPRRLPLTGLELRGCWEERLPTPTEAAVEASLQPPVHRLRLGEAGGAVEASSAPPRTFIPVELVGPLPARGATPDEAAGAGPIEAVAPPLPLMAAELDEGWAERTSLFGEPDG